MSIILAQVLWSPLEMSIVYLHDIVLRNVSIITMPVESIQIVIDCSDFVLRCLVFYVHVFVCLLAVFA